MPSRSKPPPRVYVPDEMPAHGVCEVPTEQAHHLAHVLRLSVGDAVTVFDGHGHEYDAAIERATKSGVTLKVGSPRAVDRESKLQVVLAQGISSGERMDYTLQKAVELGVAAVQPLATERSVVRLSEERSMKRLAHWRGIAIAACAQCGRNVVPPVMPVVPIDSWLATLADDGVRVMLTPGAALRLSEMPRPSGRVVLLVGPEGGLSPRERENAARAGFAPLRLGPRVLRTETAALAALAALQSRWGDL